MIDKERYKVINGNSLEILATLEENSIDACITDPPYGLTSITKRFGKPNSAPAQQGKDGSFAKLSKGFMGKERDGSGIEYNIDFWSKVYRALKPGAYLLAFGGSRTFHRIACAIEDAGFEIRDTIMWLYGSGFPKSLNIGLAIDKKRGVESEVVGTGKSGSANTHTRCMNSVTKSGEDVFGGEYKIKKANNEWSGWGSCLKPAFEPIIMARKPFKGSLVDNVLEYGVGGINIDECRIETDEAIETGRNGRNNKSTFQASETNNIQREFQNVGRFPANIIHDGSDEVVSGMPETSSSYGEANYEFGNQNNPTHLYTNIKSGVHFQDSGSASRYFYCAKASNKDRDDGLDMFALCKNIHPTVKPVELMQYLVRLVCPKGATILDPFNGSGSTGKAVAFENRERNMDYKYIGIELDKEYCKISEARIDYAINKYQYDMIQDIKEKEEKTGQLSLFDF